MTRIDFYILPEGGKPPEGAVMTACKLCDKASSAGQRVYVYVPDGEVSGNVDSALWSFRQGSFVPHERQGAAPLQQPLPAVLIGGAEPPDEYHEVMINLGAEVPAFFSRFERVMEIVDGDAAQRAKSRERYKFYRDRGYELASHNL
ncbi:MAG: DNA polymerase III subunit chi [Nevskia sp.]|nr:DNA polymerase III subunit chi [Nevskia sp.]